MAAFHNQHFPQDLKDWKVNFYSQARRLFARYHPAGEPSRVDGVAAQIERDRTQAQKLSAAQQAGAAVVTLQRDQVVRPRFMTPH
jgi:hypothetical protein